MRRMMKLCQVCFVATITDLSLEKSIMCVCRTNHHQSYVLLVHSAAITPLRCSKSLYLTTLILNVIVGMKDVNMSDSVISFLTKTTRISLISIKFALGEAYDKDTKEDKKKLRKFYAENTHLLLQRASFYLERKDYKAALSEIYFAMFYNPRYEYLSTVFSELALDVGPTLGLMTEVQEGFFQAIKDLQNYEILGITVGVMDSSKRLNKIVDLAKNKVDDVEGKANLTMLKEHFNFTFMPYIKEALDTKAASFKVINMYSHLEYEYYIEHVDVKRETKARIYVGDLLSKKYDWMGLVVKAGCDGFRMYLCPNFEAELEIQEDELKELVEKYLVKNQKS